jgi:hypothetical protein
MIRWASPTESYLGFEMLKLFRLRSLLPYIESLNLVGLKYGIKLISNKLN